MDAQSPKKEPPMTEAETRPQDEDRYAEAVAHVKTGGSGPVSILRLQCRMRINFIAAATYIDRMEADGIVVRGKHGLRELR